MKFSISTSVNRSAKDVLSGFDAELFLALKPPLLPLSLEQFDGCETGDRVKLKLGMKPFEQKWHALITEHGETNDSIYFIDVGEKLPFPLKDWCHRHFIHKNKNGGSVIEDNITYTTGYVLLDVILYLPLYFTFFIRKRIYRQFFN